MSETTIVIPVKNPVNIKEFIERNEFELINNKVIVIDSGGGEALKSYSTVYIEADVSMEEARKIGYALVDTTYTLNLDSDMIIPSRFVRIAESRLRMFFLNGAVSLLHKREGRIVPHLTFGCSLWKTDVLRILYDYGPKVCEGHEIIQVGESEYVVAGFPYCECWYMWKKLDDAGYNVAIIRDIILCDHLK